MSGVAPDRIPLARPHLAPGAEEAAQAVIRSGHLVRGAHVQRLEGELRDRLGDGVSALCVNSGTAALHVALEAVGVGPGDEVVLPDLCFPSLANVIMRLGAEPVPVDVSLDTFNATAEAMLAAVTARTRAVVPVHQFGLPMPLAPLMEAADTHGFSVVEDAACALGAETPEGPCGVVGHVGAYSFHPRKHVTTAEGGAVVTRDEALFARVSSLANHGMVPAEDYRSFVHSGWNFRMSDVHAALSEGQLPALDGMLAERRRLAAAYGALLADVPGVTVPAGHRLSEHTFQSYVVVLDEDVDRRRVLSRLREQGVEANIASYALHVQPYFAQRHPKSAALSRPGSLAAFQRAVALPFFVGLTADQQKRVAEALGAAVRGVAHQFVQFPGSEMTAVKGGTVNASSDSKRMFPEDDIIVETRDLRKTFSTWRWSKAGPVPLPWGRPTKVEAVAGLDLEVRRGEVFGFLGPNGAGKTTTIKMLMGLIQPTKGELRLFGGPPHELTTRRRIGYLPETPYFYDYLKARELLDFYGRLFRIRREQRRKTVDELLEVVGLEHARNRKLRTFSKGMLQRVGIASALINDPDLVVLDEPLSGLDPIGRKEMRDVILRLRESGKTVFFSSHILSDAELVCDKVAIINRGLLRSVGRLDELMDVETLTSELMTTGLENPEVALADVPSANVETIAGYERIMVDERELDRALRAILDAGGHIESVSRRRESLEDVFVRTASGGAEEPKAEHGAPQGRESGEDRGSEATA